MTLIIDDKFIQRRLADVPLLCDRNFSEQFCEALWANSVKNPNRLAIINAHDQKDSITYVQLYNASLSVAAFLEDRGIRKGDVYCLVLPNNWEYMAAFAGGTLIGGVASGCSMSFKPFELARQFNDSKAKMVFCSEKKLVEVVEALKLSPKIQLVIVVGREKSKNTLGFVNFQTLLETPPFLKTIPAKIDAKTDLIMLPYSSGTTGIPKGAMISHQNFGTMMSAYIFYNQTNPYKYILPNFNPCTENLLLVLPFYHMYGMSIVTSALMEGYTVVAIQQFSLELYCQCIQDFKIKQLHLVPPIALLLAKSPLINNYDLSSLNSICCGAAPLGEELCRELKQRLKLKYIGQGYGLTEISMAAYLPNTEIEKPSVCGYLIPTLEMKIVDIESQQALPAYKKGEICFRGPTVFRGYIDKPKATAETIDGEGWIHTGDVGFFDKDGQLVIVERIKELIKVNAYQVPPAELEDVLLGHPSIADCAVIGVPDERTGESPKAFVVRRDSTLTEKDVFEYVAERLAAYKHIKYVEFVGSIPKSPSGKILRRELRDAERLKSRI